MDFDKLDSIVTCFIDKKDFHISTLPSVVDISKKIITEELPIEDDVYSRDIEINESIDIVYNFLEQINVEMAHQFKNIINMKDEKNNPYVNILPRSQYLDGHDEVKDGRVYIYYENTPNDPFVILHEVLHKMNECNIVNDNNEEFETYTRDYFGETVSIMGELMLGKYMIENGLITEKDFNIRKKNRLISSKENARDVIIEKELIDLKLQGKDINFESLMKSFEKYNQESIEYKVLNDEKKDLRRLSSILENNSLNLIISQRYVIAQYLSEELFRRDTLERDFVSLFYAVGDANSDIGEVYKEIIHDDVVNKSVSM